MLESTYRRGLLSTIATWPTWQLVLAGALASLAGQFVIAVVMLRIFGDPLHVASPFAGRPLWIQLLFPIVLAPLYETLIFQWGIIKLLHGPLRRSWFFSAFVSTIVFGLCHGYTDWRAFSLLATSTTLAAVFVIEARRAGSPYLATASTHGLFNGLVVWCHWS